MPTAYTVLSHGLELPAQTLDALRATITGAGAEIAAESDYVHPTFVAHAFHLRPGAVAAVRRALASNGTDDGAAALVPDDLRNAARKFVIMDVDSTLIQQEVIELLAAHAGKEAEVAAVTAAAMRGELDFAESLHHRVATLAGLPESVLTDVGQKIRLTPGAERLVREAKDAGHVVAAVSGGFAQILAPLARTLGLDYALANELEIVDGQLTGKVVGAVVDRAAKATALRTWSAESGIPIAHTMAIGDGANDLDMMEAAGLGVAFNAKPAVRAAADAQINIPYLDVALALAGI